MANNVSNVTTGKPMVSGGVWYAPLGSTLPTDATTALGSAFVCVGYISSDGVTNSNTFSSDTVRAWGGDPVLHTKSEFADEYKFTMIESTNINALKAFYGEGNVTEDAKNKLITVKKNTKTIEKHVWVIERITTRGQRVRTVIPSGDLTARDDITYTDTDPVGYGVTISGEADENGQTSYEYVQVA